MLNKSLELLILREGEQLSIELVEDLFIYPISGISVSSLHNFDCAIDYLHYKVSVVFIRS